MGLGNFLLNGGQALAALQADALGGSVPPPRRAAFRSEQAKAAAVSKGKRLKKTPPRGKRTAAADTLAAASSPLASAEAAAAAYVILLPALGCPCLVNPAEGELKIILLCTDGAATDTKTLVDNAVHLIFVADWDKVRAASTQDGNEVWPPADSKKLVDLVDLNGCKLDQPESLDSYRQKNGKQVLERARFQHNIEGIVLDVYQKKGFTRILGARLKLKKDHGLAEQHLYTLYYAPENGLIRSILDDETMLEKPFGDIPVITEGSTVRIGGSNQLFCWPEGTNRNHLVRLFHPFWIPKAAYGSEYLNIGHLTDLHVATLWDYFDRKIYDSYDPHGADLLLHRTIDDAQSPFEDLAKRFNNPNWNLRSLTGLLNRQCANESGDQNDYVDLIIHTGDLTDYNRGFNRNDKTHDPAKDYLFNLNWLRYFELLLLDYQRPTFTLLGNHDRHVNQYPPVVKPEWDQYFEIAFVSLAIAAVGTLCGSLYGACEEGNVDFLEFIVVPLLCPLLLFGFSEAAVALAPGLTVDMWNDIILSKKPVSLLIFIGYVLGLIFTLCLKLIDTDGTDKIKTAKDGTTWGAVVGSIGGLGVGIILAIVLPIVVKVTGGFDFMTHIVNLHRQDLTGSETGEGLLQGKKAEYLNLFTRDGIFSMNDRAFDWYALVINPFRNYVVRYGNMSLLMVDWEGSEIVLGDPPLADDEFTDLQWATVDLWIRYAVGQRESLRNQGVSAAQKRVNLVMGLHTPVFCPTIESNLALLNTGAVDPDNDALKRGTMTVNRGELIRTCYQLARGTYPGVLDPIQVFTLAGHTHDYDIFRLEAEDKVRWYQNSDWTGEKRQSDFGDLGLHVTTSSAGPPGDGVMPDARGKKLDEQLAQAKPYLTDPAQKKTKENYWISGSNETYQKPGDRVMRPPGGRVISFDRKTGQLIGLQEISVEQPHWGDA